MDLVTEFLRHNSTMNDRLLDVCSRLDPDQLEATAVGVYGGIGAMLVHIANAQIAYVPRFVAADRPKPLPESPFPGFEALRERMTAGNELLEVSAGRSGEEHEVQVSGDDPPGTWSMPASLLLLQAVNHGTEHRSQVSTVLTTLGLEPPEMDGWTYFELAGLLEEV